MTYEGTLRHLQRMVASSSAFQEEVQKYTTDAATVRVHLWEVEEPDALPRPWALIGVEDASDQLTGTGGGNSFGLMETLMLSLCTELPQRETPQEAMCEFWEWGKTVREQVLELAGSDDWLNITAMPLEQKPMMAPPQAGYTTAWAWMQWRVQIEGHTALR